MQEETIWIIEAKEGSQSAFRELYNANVLPLYRFLKQFGSDSDQVEEWVQRAFVKAFEHLDSFDSRSRFSSWLFRLALNEMRMDWRRRQIVAFVPVDDEHEDQSHGTDPFEWKQLMKTWMDELDETKRAVFILYEVEGYTHAEIGSMLGIAESSSRTLLVRAKRFLQDRWIKEAIR
jgi:RNA polymerase sigma-70 factor (ECF subfamily)